MRIQKLRLYTIHKISNHSNKYKHAAYYFVLNRLNKISMYTKDYKHDLSTIKYKVQENGKNPRNDKYNTEENQNKNSRTTLL